METMNDNDVIAEIKWTVADVRDAFVRKYGRQPSNGELSDCVQNVDCKNLEDYSIECGWSFIEEAII